MSKDEKQKLSGTYLYVFFAVVAAILICVGLMTLFSTSDGKSEKRKVADTSSPQTKQATVTEAPSTQTPATQAPPETQPPTPSEDASAPAVEYCLPVSGPIIKTHDPLLAVFSMTMNDYRAHTGVDVAAEPETPVLCFTAGKITNVYDDKFWGTCVEVEHDGGLCSVYRNLSPSLPENIAPGCVVDVGQQIASVGESAKLEAADSPHLHFELTKDGVQVDPTEYLSFPESETPKED